MKPNSASPDEPVLGISLTGGGARGSYQAGALLAVAEIIESLGFPKNPISYWSGVSAGAINTCFMASAKASLLEQAQRLVDLWNTITPSKVYKTDAVSLGRNSVKWIKDLSFGGKFSKSRANFLLDTEPLKQYLKENIDFHQIHKNFEAQLFRGFSVSAYNYSEGKTVSYIIAPPEIGWQKRRRCSQHTKIDEQKVLASCAIPVLFPTVKVEGEYCADGSFRNLSPVSPLIHMGAKKLLVIGVRGPHELSGIGLDQPPGIARISGQILNALFFDTLDVDIERIHHINEMLSAIKSDLVTDRSDYTLVDFQVIRPSHDIAKLVVERNLSHFPTTVEFLLAGLGSKEETSELASYILFEKTFTRELLDLGYNDVRKDKAAIQHWLTQAT
ncbi:MAG: patatin family protein [Bdellovibrionales bacterium CG10_big_fil_rev_8_21_14_0_10_45_34]|nr:MAG: patatin family protein [Bdellovibrionales bacterium CG10_big_fil_rev_8_21_14_0_10_45_34]